MNKLIKYYKAVSKTTKIHLIVLILLLSLEIIITTRFNYIFGSNTDWLKQHVAFADYFRNLFYESKNIFPNWALHIGSGQNIFYLAYYGLFNPILIISYLLPFVKMGNYIMISSILLVIISIILLYYFLRKNKFNNSICFFVSLLFLTTSSFIFHSHRHIMFINYMPFLILALIGVYKYFEKKDSKLLIISTFLMILTSYYYSISGIITICLYALYNYLKRENINPKSFINEMFKFLKRILVSILLASFLLLPVIYIVLNGRNSNISINYNYLIPRVNLEFLMYGTYGIGLTSILWISLIYNIIYLKKENKITSILLALITILPIINLLLNGFLYLNGKVLMPFIPLFLLLIASMIKDIDLSKKSFKSLYIGIIIATIIFIQVKFNNRYLFFIIESILTIILLNFYKKYKKNYYLVPIIIISFIICVTNNISDDLIDIDIYKQQEEILSYDVNNYLNKNSNSLFRYQDNLSVSDGMNFSYGQNDFRTTIYSSTSNLDYLNAFNKNFSNNNPLRNYLMLYQKDNILFNHFMGISYLLTNDHPPYGYKEIKKYSQATLYENTNVYPIGFSNTHILNRNEYENLSYIEKLLAYQKNIIIDKDTNNAILDNSYNKINLDFNISYQKGININYYNNHYEIDSTGGNLILDLKNSINSKTIIIRFKMNDIPKCVNEKGDTYISINGIKNLLTCDSWRYYNNNEIFEYVLSSNDEIKQLNIDIGVGKYDISDLEIYEVDNAFFDDTDITPLIETKYEARNEAIVGTINQEEDGYFIFTIPYDNGYKAYVDGKEIEIEKVNDCFIGFPIDKGIHSIKLTFTSPYFNLGKIVSIIGLLSFTCIIIHEKKYQNE